MTIHHILLAVDIPEGQTWGDLPATIAQTFASSMGEADICPRITLAAYVPSVDTWLASEAEHAKLTQELDAARLRRDEAPSPDPALVATVAAANREVLLYAELHTAHRRNLPRRLLADVTPS